MKNLIFWNLGILVLGFVNYLFEKHLINLEVGEICIIIILLSVLIFLINEINTFLKENIEPKATVPTNFKTISFLDGLKKYNLNINILGKIIVQNLKKYNLYFTII